MSWFFSDSQCRLLLKFHYFNLLAFCCVACRFLWACSCFAFVVSCTANLQLIKIMEFECIGANEYLSYVSISLL